MSTTWIQRIVRLKPCRRGFHEISEKIFSEVPEIRSFRVGLLHVFLRHTSASLTINENADPDVPRDLERSLNSVAPEDFPYVHTAEGPDDMPAHVKSALLGCAVSVPIQDGRLLLGTWQGIFLGEHRNHAGERQVVVTVQGETG